MPTTTARNATGSPTATGPTLRAPLPADGQAMWELARASGLDENSPYAYVMWGEYHSGTSVVAVDDDGELVGFVMGFLVPDSPETVFVWQIATSAAHRGAGIGARLLDALVDQTGARVVEATVTPDNGPSAALFRGLGSRHGSRVEETPLFAEDLFPGGHEAEVRFRIPVGTP